MIEFMVIYTLVAVLWAIVWSALTITEWNGYIPDEDLIKRNLKLVFCTPIWFVPALLMLWKLFAYAFDINLTRKDEDVQVD